MNGYDLNEIFRIFKKNFGKQGASFLISLEVYNSPVNPNRIRNQ